MRTTICLALMALASQVAIAHIVRHRAIPQEYQGTWANGAAACGVDKGAIVIAARTYATREDNCEVVYVDETASPEGSTYAVRLSCTHSAGTNAAGTNAAGAEKKSFINLIIRPDKDGISVGPTFEGLVAYQRCQLGGADTKQ